MTENSVKNQNHRIEVFYKFVQPVLTTITSIGIVAVLTLIINLDKNQAVTKVEIENLESQISEIQLETQDRYTSEKASKDLEIRDLMLKNLSNENARILKRIEKIENEL
jgi:hypothetical protein